MSASNLSSEDAGVLAERGAVLVNEAKALEGTLHLGDTREVYRRLLNEGIPLVSRALGALADPKETTRARRLLVVAHVARAEDACYGAGQLSRSAQRAPTLEDCDDGWGKVEAIAQNAEASAKEGRALAEALGNFRSKELAKRAEAAAHSARLTVQGRNRAYTFFSIPGFSFGEGWYAAAASLLAGVPLQVKGGTAGEASARRFLRDVGLSDAVQPYRSRPANPKHLTDLIARAFSQGPGQAQATLRRAFLGEGLPPSELTHWIRQRLHTCQKKKVLLWVRTSLHDAHRNTDFEELQRLASLVVDAGLAPVFFGDAIAFPMDRSMGIDLSLCWQEPLFQGLDMRRMQLQLFETLRDHHGLVGQVGVTTAGMDGPALLGLPTCYLTSEPNVRMAKWVDAVPGYEELVREDGYMDKLRATLKRWRTEGQVAPHRK